MTARRQSVEYLRFVALLADLLLAALGAFMLMLALGTVAGEVGLPRLALSYEACLLIAVALNVLHIPLYGRRPPTSAHRAREVEPSPAGGSLPRRPQALRQATTRGRS